jgi:hypothetical protein
VAATVGNRVTPRAELDGVDVPEMGIEGYAMEPMPEELPPVFTDETRSES